MPITCKCPFSSAVRVATVIQHVGIVSGAIRCAKFQKRFKLRMKSIKSKSTCGIVTAIRLNHVICKEPLYGIKHTSWSQIELLYMLRWKQCWLPIRTRNRKRRYCNLIIFANRTFSCFTIVCSATKVESWTILEPYCLLGLKAECSITHHWNHLWKLLSRSLWLMGYVCRKQVLVKKKTSSKQGDILWLN